MLWTLCCLSSDCFVMVVILTFLLFLFQTFSLFVHASQKRQRLLHLLCQLSQLPLQPSYSVMVRLGGSAAGHELSQEKVDCLSFDLGSYLVWPRGSPGISLSVWLSLDVGVSTGHDMDQWQVLSLGTEKVTLQLQVDENGSLDFRWAACLHCVLCALLCFLPLSSFLFFL